VHRGYEKVFNSVTATSALADAEVLGLPVGQALMKGTGTLKHSLLLFDTFHAMRMSAKAMSLKGSPAYGKGLSLLEYKDADLATAVKNGEITQTMADYAKAKRPIGERLVANGLNVGRVQEALYSDIVRQIPLAGDFNKWVFEKLTRGTMMESAIKEFERVKKANPALGDDAVARKVSKDLNIYFGNLGRQGVFRSRTFQDLARLVFLAPQWFESMAQTEGRALGQAVKVPFTGKVGSIAKGTGSLLFATFVATQLTNLITKHRPTWQNDEGHKLDAWIHGAGS